MYCTYMEVCMPVVSGFALYIHMGISMLKPNGRAIVDVPSNRGIHTH